jgi:hypothetical protein
MVIEYANVSIFEEYEGELLSCHSEHDMSRLKFSNGIQEGKLMANEYPSVLLLLAVTMNSSEGRKM